MKKITSKLLVERGTHATTPPVCRVNVMTMPDGDVAEPPLAT
jgi:hypothetical protein